MPRKKKKPVSREKSRKKSPKRAPRRSAPKRDKRGRFVAKAPVRKSRGGVKRKSQRRKSLPRDTKRVRPRARKLPVSDFEFVDESEIGDIEQYFGDEDVDLEEEEEEEIEHELDELEEELDEDESDYDFDAMEEMLATEFDEEDFGDEDVEDVSLARDETPLILGEWSNELADVDIEQIDTVEPDDISEAVWEEILGEDFGFDDMAEMYAEDDIYEFEIAISYGEAA